MLFRVCPDCGCSLDPGERCDCQDKEKTALDAANIQSGKVEQKSNQLHCSASILTDK